jgi:hypothetical protein
MTIDARIALLEQDMQSLLGNGQPGLISIIRADLNQIKEVAMKARFVLMGMFIGLMTMMFLSGTGVVSLKSLIAWMFR